MVFLLLWVVCCLVPVYHVFAFHVYMCGGAWMCCLLPGVWRAENPGPVSLGPGFCVVRVVV